MGALPNDWMAILNDMVAAIQASIAADGQTPITGSLNFGGFRLRNAGAPQGQGDALRFEQMMKGADVASAATIAFPIEGSLFDVTGTTTITGISGAFPGRMVLVRFIDALTLTNGTNLILPGGADITTQTGDFAAFVCLDGTKWQCWLYPRAQNDAILRPASSDHFGPTEPAETWSGMTWADSGTNTLWRRNAADDGWDYEHRILDDATTDLQWLGTPIGGYITPHSPPPTNDLRYRYILCTAGQTGVGGYNEGVLTGETVTGSSPNIVATAVVSLAGSPMDGQTIRLVNTTREFFRPGATEGITQLSQNAEHDHAGAVRGSADVQNSVTPNRYSANSASTTGSSGGDEARPRNISAVYYRRIK
ncbi:hypothetical protein [Castellaniella denitrificans]|uniref:Tail fiber protein n=1 Tax=Castellaniella denitrificans TaxID=56119 RepID=A0ABT4M629_9BURK|nr:hypothetical protein [Castellaniella denitrificans]MCZ4330782.1 hypothetical protein [Castellaniella denitrificans]